MSTEDTATQEEEVSYPRGWRFDEDGAEVRGTFVNFDTGFTADYGQCPIVVLDVNGENRSVWLFHTALRNRFAQEVNEREFVEGEQVNIKQLGKKKGASGYTYTAYAVAFPDAPKKNAKDIFKLDAIDKAPESYEQPKDELPTDESW